MYRLSHRKLSSVKSDFQSCVLFAYAIVIVHCGGDLDKEVPKNVHIEKGALVCLGL